MVLISKCWEALGEVWISQSFILPFCMVGFLQAFVFTFIL